MVFARGHGFGSVDLPSVERCSDLQAWRDVVWNHKYGKKDCLLSNLVELMLEDTDEFTGWSLSKFFGYVEHFK